MKVKLENCQNEIDSLISKNISIPISFGILNNPLHLTNILIDKKRNGEEFFAEVLKNLEKDEIILFYPVINKDTIFWEDSFSSSRLIRFKSTKGTVEKVLSNYDFDVEEVIPIKLIDNSVKTFESGNIYVGDKWYE